MIFIFAMKISFAHKSLEKQANDYKLCSRKMGARRAELFQKRLNDLRNSKSLEDVRYLPGRYHELTGNRKGQWACDLDHPYRLIFEPQEKPIPTDKDGKYIWLEIKAIEIIEITDYH